MLKPNITPDSKMAELQEKLKKMSPEELREFQKKQCVFCQIISGKIPSKKVYEDAVSFSVLDINPANLGHMLLMPKEHYSIMPQVPDADLKHLFKVAKSLSSIALKGLKAEGTSIFIANGAAAGQRATHFMIHIIPRTQDDHVPLSIPQKNVQKESLEKIRIQLSKKVEELLGPGYTEFDTKSVQERAQAKPESNRFEQPILEAEYTEPKAEPKQQKEQPKTELKKGHLKSPRKKESKEFKKGEPRKETTGESSLDEIARVLGGN